VEIKQQVASGETIEISGTRGGGGILKGEGEGRYVFLPKNIKLSMNTGEYKKF
jgi:hypothetical protein